jgi:tRNA threonylcarbamoyladenosine modification (KEOPS) complex Cgi121 subunit
LPSATDWCAPPKDGSSSPDSDGASVVYLPIGSNLADTTTMDFLRRLFGSAERQRDDAIHLYVACGRCQAVVHVRVDPRNDLMPEYGDGDDLIGYRLIKEIMDSRCFRLMRAEIEYDARRREIRRTIEGGAFITRDEYEQRRWPQPSSRD